MVERFANKFVGYIQNVGGIDDTETEITLNVAPPAALGAGDWRARIEDELVLVTSVLGSVGTVTRGIEGTTPAAHAQGIPVTHVLTAAALDALTNSTAITTVTDPLYAPITQDWPLPSWGQDGIVATGTGVHYFAVPYNMTITRIDGTLSANGATALTITLNNMYDNAGTWTADGTNPLVTTSAQELIAASGIQGSITSFAAAAITAGNVLRLDIDGADASASDPVITVWARRT